MLPALSAILSLEPRRAMAPGKRQRTNTSSSAAAATTPGLPIEWTLPADLLLEIIARSDPSTLESCAATCKLLRRDILSPFFLRRIIATRQDCAVPPCVLAYLDTTSFNKTLSLVHPITPAAASFHGHLKRFVSRVATAGVLDQYHDPVASRRGLVVFRRPLSRRRSSSDLCVYDTMTGAHTFLSYPPDIPWISATSKLYHRYVQLTAADGIGIDRSSFMLVVAELKPWTIKVQTAGSSGTWGPVISCEKHLDLVAKSYSNPAVLHGGVIHWLARHDYDGNTTLTYDIRSTKLGTAKLPPAIKEHKLNKLHLGTSPDGKLLKLLAIDGFIMSVWLQLVISDDDDDPAGAGHGGNNWALEAAIDMEEKLRSLEPAVVGVEFDGSGDRSANVVLLLVRGEHGGLHCMVLDLETMEMHKQEWESSLLLEINLLSRLQAMKIYP